MMIMQSGIPRDALEGNVASQMLFALLQDGDAPQIELDEDAVSLSEKKKYLMKNLDNVDVEARRHVGNLLVKGGRADLIQACSNGSVVNLRSVPDHIIKLMYAELIYRMSLRK